MVAPIAGVAFPGRQLAIRRFGCRCVHSSASRAHLRRQVAADAVHVGQAASATLGDAKLSGGTSAAHCGARAVIPARAAHPLRQASQARARERAIATMHGRALPGPLRLRARAPAGALRGIPARLRQRPRRPSLSLPSRTPMLPTTRGHAHGAPRCRRTREPAACARRGQLGQRVVRSRCRRAARHRARSRRLTPAAWALCTA